MQQRAGFDPLRCAEGGPRRRILADETVVAVEDSHRLTRVETFSGPVNVISPLGHCPMAGLPRWYLQSALMQKSSIFLIDSSLEPLFPFLWSFCFIQITVHRNV